MITKLFFLLSESFRALSRAKLSAFISSLTIAIALLVFSIAYFTYVNLLGYSYKFKSLYQIESDDPPYKIGANRIINYIISKAN